MKEYDRLDYGRPCWAICCCGGARSEVYDPYNVFEHKPINEPVIDPTLDSLSCCEIRRQWQQLETNYATDRGCLYFDWRYSCLRPWRATAIVTCVAGSAALLAFSALFSLWVSRKFSEPDAGSNNITAYVLLGLSAVIGIGSLLAFKISCWHECIETYRRMKLDITIKNRSVNGSRCGECLFDWTCLVDRTCRWLRC